MNNANLIGQRLGITEQVGLGGNALWGWSPLPQSVWRWWCVLSSRAGRFADTWWGGIVVHFTDVSF